MQSCHLWEPRAISEKRRREGQCRGAWAIGVRGCWGGNERRYARAQLGRTHINETTRWQNCHGDAEYSVQYVVTRHPEGRETCLSRQGLLA